MKIKPEEISRIIQTLLLEWKKNDGVTFLLEEARVAQRLEGIFFEELQVEEKLDREVEALLTQHERQFKDGILDRRKMFLLIKARLVKERNVVL